MNPRSIISNASVAFLAQGVGLVLGVVQSLLVPKLLDIENYAYWQLFIFYASYVGFFHLGLNDGVYLIYGGQSRAEIDKRSVNSQFVVGAAFQLLFSCVIVAFALMGKFGPDREFVIACVALYLLLQNLLRYISFVLQAMNETKLSSYSAIVASVTYLIPLIVMLFAQVTSYRPYIIAYLVSAGLALVYGLRCVRDFRHAGLEKPSQAVAEAIQSIRVGIKLMIANLASSFVLGAARFIIDAVWGIETFGQLSLSLSMVTFFMAFMSQASMVLFPALRQSKESEIRGFYFAARDFMGLLFPAIYILYLPVVWALTLWLPQYASSFSYLAYLLPICVFDSKMDITCTTYFKVVRKERLLLRINLVTALASLLGSLVGAYCFASIHVVIAAVVVAIMARSTFSEHYITREMDLSPSTISVAEIFLTVAFVVLTVFVEPLVALTGYLVLYAVFLWFHRSRLLGLLRQSRDILQR